MKRFISLCVFFLSVGGFAFGQTLPIDTISVVNGLKLVGATGGRFDTAYTKIDTVGRFSKHSQLFVVSVLDLTTRVLWEKRLDKKYENLKYFHVSVHSKYVNTPNNGSDNILFYFGDGNTWIRALNEINNGPGGGWVEYYLSLKNPPENFIVDRIRIQYGLSYSAYGNTATWIDNLYFDLDEAYPIDSSYVIDTFGDETPILQLSKSTSTMNNTSNPRDSVFVKNTGNLPLVISKMDITAPYFMVSPDTMTVAVNDEISRNSSLVYLELDRFAPSGTHEALLIIHSNSVVSPDTIKLKGDVVTGIENISVAPTTYSLSQNYPNPFNPSTKIQFGVTKEAFVTLKVYDMLGREVETLVNGEKSSGAYEVSFDASSLPSGVYIYRLQVQAAFVETKKMVLMK